MLWNIWNKLSEPLIFHCINHQDLELIDVLWRQDVDLGCGKEAFDPNLRLELEKEKELEAVKQQEKVILY